MAPERRTSRRIRIVGVRVTYQSGNDERVEADALDLGTGGVFVRTAAPLAVGKRISLEMQVVGEQGPWSALGRVVWSREKGEGEKAPPGMGVKIIDADDAVLAAIERLVETRERTEPGMGKESTPPPSPGIGVAPERERTLLGVGISPADVPSVPPGELPSEPVEDLSSDSPELPSEPVEDLSSDSPEERPGASPEANAAWDRAATKPVSIRPPAVLAPPRAAEPDAVKGGGRTGRLVVMLLLLVVAGVAAYVLLDGFVHPPRWR